MPLLDSVIISLDNHNKIEISVEYSLVFLRQVPETVADFRQMNAAADDNVTDVRLIWFKCEDNHCHPQLIPYFLPIS
jgi:hypothetical protein